MKNGKSIGMMLFIGGIILLIAYGLYLGFEDLMETLNLISGLLLVIIIVGLIILILSIVREQRKDQKEIMKEIKKEDLEP